MVNYADFYEYFMEIMIEWSFFIILAIDENFFYKLLDLYEFLPSQKETSEIKQKQQKNFKFMYLINDSLIIFNLSLFLYIKMPFKFSCYSLFHYQYQYLFSCAKRDKRNGLIIESY